MRLRLRKESGTWSTQDPTVGFYLLKKILGSKVNRLVGDRQVMSVESARQAAKDLLGKLMKGEDPKEERRQEQEVQALQSLTYRQALEEFLAAADITEGTRKKYRTESDHHLQWTWRTSPCLFHPGAGARDPQGQQRAEQVPGGPGHACPAAGLELGKEQPQDRRRGGGPGQEPRGHPEQAGARPRATRLEQRAAQGKHHPEGAAARLVCSRATDPRREGISEARQVSCLLLEALALTGLRFNELTTLPWSRVNLGMGTITIPDTTSKNRRPLVRPITRRVREILGQLAKDSGTYVFPGREEEQPLNNTRKLQLELQTRDRTCGSPPTICGASTPARPPGRAAHLVIKRLLNHMGHEEVTEGYIRLGLDELLDYSQAVEDTILGDAGLLASRNLDHRLVLWIDERSGMALWHEPPGDG